MVNIHKKGCILYKYQNILGTSFHISPEKYFYAHISSLKNCSYHMFSEVRETFFQNVVTMYHKIPRTFLKALDQKMVEEHP